MSVSAAVVAEDGRVLVVRRRDNGHWEPPGGVLELDESIEDGLRREVLEETGLDVQPIRLTGVYKNMECAIVALVFRAVVVSGAETLTDEVSEQRWLIPDQFRETLDEAYAVRLEEALLDGPAFVHSHDGRRVIS